MQCRIGCGACCIEASLNLPFWGMPQGKKAGERCVHLSEQRLCLIFDDPRRPQACRQFQAELSICGESFAQASANLALLELATQPCCPIITDPC
jgi:Fe-S-cluster containining protein